MNLKGELGVSWKVVLSIVVVVAMVVALLLLNGKGYYNVVYGSYVSNISFDGASAIVYLSEEVKSLNSENLSLVFSDDEGEHSYTLENADSIQVVDLESLGISDPKSISKVELRASGAAVESVAFEKQESPFVKVYPISKAAQTAKKKSSGGGGGGSGGESSDGGSSGGGTTPEPQVGCSVTNTTYNFTCSDGSVYWFDNCGARGSVKENCSGGCGNDACLSGICADNCTNIGYTCGIHNICGLEVDCGDCPQTNATAIARWDVVPYQEFNDTFNVGVVAFHKNGINRVDFFISGALIGSSNEMTLNPQTGVWEYWTELDAAEYSSSQLIKIDALVYPSFGEVRNLSDGSLTQIDAGDGSLYLWVDKGDLAHQIKYASDLTGNDNNDGNTPASAYKTLKKAYDSVKSQEGGIIYLLAGNYYMPSAFDEPLATRRWITISSAPGVLKSEVNIVGREEGARWNSQKLYISNLTFRLINETILIPSNRNVSLWLDNVDILAETQFSWQPIVQGGSAGAQLTSYWTDIYMKDFVNPVSVPWGNLLIVRNVYLENVGEDAFRVTGLLVNATAKNVGGFGIGHTDLVQAGFTKNFIIFGLKAIDIATQGIYMHEGDWAIVNVLIDSHDSSYNYYFSDQTCGKHILLWYLTVSNQTAWWRPGDATYECEDISIRNSEFDRVLFGNSSNSKYTNVSYLLEVIDFDNNHFVSGTSYGTRATNGSPDFSDVANNNFSPSSSSVLINRATPIVPVDVYGNIRKNPGAIGAVEYP